MPMHLNTTKMSGNNGNMLAMAPHQVLLVEDNYSDVLLVSHQLREAAGEEDVEITNVARLQDALELLDSHDFKIILLDLNLLDADGTEVITALRQKAPHIAVAVYSGTSDPLVRQEAILCGASYYMVKGRDNGALLWHLLNCKGVPCEN